MAQSTLSPSTGPQSSKRIKVILQVLEHLLNVCTCSQPNQKASHTPLQMVSSHLDSLEPVTEHVPACSVISSGGCLHGQHVTDKRLHGETGKRPGVPECTALKEHGALRKPSPASLMPLITAHRDIERLHSVNHLQQGLPVSSSQ